MFGSIKAMSDSINYAKSERFSKDNIAHTLEKVLTFSHPLILGHSTGDQDSIGSAIAMAIALKNSGKTCTVYLENSKELPEYFKNIILQAGIQVVDTLRNAKAASHDGIVIVDTANGSLLTHEALEYIQSYPQSENIVEIDHHQGKGSTVVANAHASLNTKEFSSTSGMVGHLFFTSPDTSLFRDGQARALCAQALLLGICGDTENFQFTVGAKTLDQARAMYDRLSDIPGVKPLTVAEIVTYVHEWGLSEKEKVIADTIVKDVHADLVRGEPAKALRLKVELPEHSYNMVVIDYEEQELPKAVIRSVEKQLGDRKENNHITVSLFSEEKAVLGKIKRGAIKRFNDTMLDLVPIAQHQDPKDGGGHEGAVGFKYDQQTMLTYLEAAYQEYLKAAQTATPQYPAMMLNLFEKMNTDRNYLRSAASNRKEVFAYYVQMFLLKNDKAAAP